MPDRDLRARPNLEQYKKQANIHPAPLHGWFFQTAQGER